MMLPLALAVPAHAAGDSLDQSLVVNRFPASYQTNLPDLAQTFTAGLTGRLDKVSIQADSQNGYAGGVTVTLHDIATDGISPGPNVLGTATNPPLILHGSAGLLSDFTFNPGVAVTDKTHYAIVVEVWAGNLKWYDSGPASIPSTDPYPGGSQFTLGRIWATTTHQDFGFEDWVATNTGPTVAVDKTALTVPEGTPAANTGTCSDPSATLSASAGTVSRCMSGAWSWTQPTDEGTQTIVITADAGQGLTSTASFTLEVTKVAPTAHILTDPLSVPEGSPVPFTGGATIPAAADSAGAVYSWTVLKNGNPYATGSGTAFSFTPDDDGTYQVTFGVRDDGGMSDSTSMTVTAINVAPKASILGVTQPLPLFIAADQTLTFNGTFSDADTADAYAITWHFGDGTTGSGRTVTHFYAGPGNYPVTFQVSDGEGGVSTATTTVHVVTAQTALSKIEAAVQNLSGLNAGEKNSLQVKLNAASAAAGRGDTKAAHNQLNAFLNELHADLNTGKVSQGDYGVLAAEVNAVQGSLGTYNRFLEWWPLEA